MKLKVPSIVIILCFSLIQINAKELGSINGRVLSLIKQEAVSGARVTIVHAGLTHKTYTDSLGNFVLDSLVFGTYNLIIAHPSYHTKTMYDLAVYESKGLFLELLLKKRGKTLNTVAVSSTRNPTTSADPMALVSARSISMAETKRFAGSLGDPSRIALSYAGVNSGRGDNNDIIIRGNSAKYMQWKLEGMQIPNPNHFGIYGSSGGLFNILNSSNLGRSNFYLGSFPAHTGNALAGVFDLSLRNGNAQSHVHSIEMSLIGLSAASEGPLSSRANGANYKVNYRFSTLGLMKKTGVVYQAPEYQDITFKLNLPTKKAGKFTIYGLGGLGTNLEEDFFRKTDSARFSIGTNGDTIYAYDEIAAVNLNKYNLGIFGVKHIIPLGERTLFKNHLNYSIVQSLPQTSAVNRDRFTTYLKSQGDFRNNTFRYQPEIMAYLNDEYTLQIGATVALGQFNSELKEGFPDNTINTIFKNKARSFLGQSFISLKRAFKKLKLIGGLHYTYFDLNGQQLVEPRLGGSYAVSKGAELSLATGLHSTTESPEVYLIIDDSLNASSRNIRMARSWQSALSFKKKLGKKMFLTIELYSQYLFDIPVAADSSNFSLLNEEISFSDKALINEGKGLNYGLEITLEKFFSNSYYFLVTTSLFQSEYSLINSNFRKSKYSNSYVFNLIGGKEFKVRKRNFLGVNVRSNISGGRPYIPVLLGESIATGQEVRDDRRAYFKQLPMYIGVDLSISYKWVRKKSSHEVKLDIFRLFEQNYLDEVFVAERLNSNGSITPASIQRIRYGEGQTASTLLPVFYYKFTF